MSRKTEVRLIGIWVIVLASACGDAGLSKARSMETPSLSRNLGVASLILDIANTHRARSGLPPLILNARLSQAAQVHAEDMATNGYFSHTSPDGSSFAERLAAAGYSSRSWGENIAYGYSNAEAAMTGWMNSSGHRANILSTGFKELGVGHASSSTGTQYWVQTFAYPLTF